MGKGTSETQRAKIPFASRFVNVLFAIMLVVGLAPTISAYAGQPETDQDAVAQSEDQAGSLPDAEFLNGEKAVNGADQDSEAVSGYKSENKVATHSDEGTDSGEKASDPEFNGDAEPKLVTEGLSVTVYKDAEHKNELGNDSVTSDATLYGQISINFASSEAPTLDHPNIKYEFPKSATVKDMPRSTLYDGHNNIAGTWCIEDGVAYLNYSEAWLKSHSSEVSAHISFEFSMTGGNSGDGSQVVIDFPGVAGSVTVNTKDGSVSGSKFGADANKEWEMPSFDASDHSYAWTIKVSPSSYATNLKIVDEIGSNLSFVAGSFKLVNKQGEAVSGKCDASIEGQKATISLGDLAKGDYYVQYKTTVSADALAALKDGQELSGVNNKAQWVWGSDGSNKGESGSKEPQKVKYSLVKKSHTSSSSPQDIEWTVDLNSGSLKADLSDYVFTDVLDAGHSFKKGTRYVVTDAAGNEVASGEVPAEGNELTFALPSNAGSQQLKVTYHTTMDDQSSTKPVSNTAKLTPSDGIGPEGEGSDSFQPTDERTYIAKELVSSEDAGTEGVATWKSRISFSTMDSDVDVSKVYFLDSFDQLPSWKQTKISDVVLATSKGEALTKGVDYDIDSSNNGEWNKLGITFKDSDLVKGLVGKDDVIVSYKTTVVSSDGTYENGTYANVSSLRINGVDKGQAKASYVIDKQTIPAVSKKASGSSWWDASYDWGDGAKGAWLTDWTVHVNCSEPNAWTHQAAGDLKGQDVVVSDSLPDGMSYVSGNGSYSLIGSNGYDSRWNQGVEPTVSGNQLTFSIKAKDVAKSDGDNGDSWKGYVSLSYRTAVKASEINAGETKEFSNSAQASSGEIKFPEGTASTNIVNKVLDKKSVRASDNSHVTYTITVNPNALTLTNQEEGGKLTLVDKMGTTAEFSNGSLHVMDGSQDITDECTVDLEKTDQGTTLTLVVPDAKKLIVTYDVAPQGNVGDEVKIENEVTMSGIASTSSKDSKKWVVNKATAGTEAANYGIVISKMDSSGTEVLKGAKFELYEVDLDKSTSDKIVSSKVTSVGENPKTTDDSGVVRFGDESHELASGKLYYYVEIEAPAGYEITKKTPSYVMFSGTSETAKKEFAEAKSKAEALGISFAEGTSFNAYDRLADGSFSLKVEKSVKGDGAPTGQHFRFSATATGDDAEDAPALGDITITDSGSAEFEGVLDSDMVGKTFTYVIHEEGDAPEGWSYDKSDVTARVKVSNEGGRVSADISYEKVGEAVSSAQFENSYEDKVWTPAEVTLGVYKTVNGQDSSDGDGDFAFRLVPQGSAPSSSCDTASVHGGGASEFGSISFEEPGTYSYVIKETSEAGEGWINDSDAAVTVVVTRDEASHRLVASVDYGERAYVANGATLAHFDNSYEKPSEPDNPDNPDNPDKPSNPDSPDEPDNPDSPDTPEQPDSPDVPEQPDAPDTPADPDDSDNGDDSGSDDGSDDQSGDSVESHKDSAQAMVADILPQTGDATILIAGALLCLVLVSGGILFATRRRGNR